MSCPNATSPIDISMSKIKGKCDKKCSYSFRYNESSCVATNRGEYISMSYDKSSSPPVIYNSSGYDVNEIRLYTPSLHSYNGTKTDGELIIIHKSNIGYVSLLVCIPIKSNNSSTISASLFKSLIDSVSSNAPSDGETTNINIDAFNLESLVPKKPFFSYSGTEPYQPCSEDVDFIVFSPLEFSLDIMPETLTKLKSIIVNNPYNIKSGPNLFFNEKGPISGNGNGEIYIDCQPVGSSVENTEIIMGNNTTTSFVDWLNNDVIKIIMGSLLFIVILYVVKYGLSMVKPVKGGEVLNGGGVRIWNT